MTVSPDSATVPANHIAEAIANGDVDGLSNLFWSYKAKTRGELRILPEGMEWDHYTLTRTALLPIANDVPADVSEALRWCVVADDIPECEDGTAGIVYLDRDTGSVMIAALCGPVQDHNVAVHMIARDLKLEEPDGLSRSASAERLRRKQRKTIRLGFVPALLPKPKEARARFDATWFGDIEDSVPKETVIKGMLGVGELTEISGLPGSGKSVIVGDAACHVAAGIDWHGRKVRQGLVIYFAAERQKLTKRRLRAFRQEHGVDDIPLLVLGGSADLTTGLADADAIATIVVLAEESCGEKCVWIIIDTLTRTFGPGDQNASKDMSKFIRSCDRLMEKTGAHLSVIHHTGWNGERGKGAIDLDGAVDASFLVKKSASGYTLHCDGANDGDEGVICHFTMKGVEVGVDDDGVPTMAPVVVPSDGVGAFKDFGVKTGRFGAIALEVLAELCRETQQHVGTEAWREGFYKRFPDDEPDTNKVRFQRVRKSLLGTPAVNYLDDKYWVTDHGTDGTCSGEVPCSPVGTDPAQPERNGTHPLGCADVPSDVSLKDENAPLAANDNVPKPVSYNQEQAA